MNSMIVCKVSLVVLMFFTEGLLAGPINSKCSTNGHINGCSTFGFKPRYKDLFTPACNKHDICYSCGAEYYTYQWSCDGQFFADMQLLCWEEPNSTVESLLECFKYANDVYYAAVSHFGSYFFEESPQDWCHQTWVTDCLGLPPSEKWWPSK